MESGDMSQLHELVRLSSKDFRSAARVAPSFGTSNRSLARVAPSTDGMDPDSPSWKSSTSTRPDEGPGGKCESARVTSSQEAPATPEPGETRADASSAVVQELVNTAAKIDKLSWPVVAGVKAHPMVSPRPPLSPFTVPRPLPLPQPDGPAAGEGGDVESPSRMSPLPASGRHAEAIGRSELWRQMVILNLKAGTDAARTDAVDAYAALAGIVAENAPVLDQGVVLPCAPTDEEKVMYHKTGRVFLVSLGVFCVGALMSGMWLFTVASPIFYWFGAPTTFIMGYLLLSYLGVAVWGEDFDVEEHEKTLSQAGEDQYYPSVDVFLPVCGEPTHVLDNTWKYIRDLDYPNTTVYVLDDGAKEEVRVLAALYGFNYIRRSNRPELKKAGNLRYAFARTSGELIVIFDADFCPRPEFLKETTPYFRNQEIAILQTPQFFRYRSEQTWVEKGAGVTQELFYRMVQVNRNKFDSAICVGTCGVYRRAVLNVFGGTAAIGYSEDVHTGFNCITLGYKVRYIPQVLSMGTCPDEPRAFFMQQYRWCMGSTTLLCNKDFWKSNLTRMQKLCYLSGMFHYSATAMQIFTGPLPGLLLIWFKPTSVLWFNVAFVLPSMFFGTVVMRLWSKQRFDFCCHRAKIIQSYAHLYAIKDKLMNTATPWVPTGGGASSRSSSKAYDSSVKLMLGVILSYTVLIVGSAMWRVAEFPWYHFVPSIALSGLQVVLNVSTLL